MVCLCMWDGEGRANAKVIHVPATVCQGPGVTRNLGEKKSDGDSDFSTFLPSSRCWQGGFWRGRGLGWKMLNTRLHSTIYKLLQKLDQVAASWCNIGKFMFSFGDGALRISWRGEVTLALRPIWRWAWVLGKHHLRVKHSSNRIKLDSGKKHQGPSVVNKKQATVKL